MSLRVVGEEQLASYGFFSVSALELAGPEGALGRRTVVRHPGAVVVVPLRQDGVVVAQYQYRAALGRDVLELPAGKRDVVDEPPEETARRELEEECGLTAHRYVLLGSFYNSPGFTDEHTLVFAATGLGRGRRAPQSGEEEQLELVGIKLDELDGLLVAGMLEDAKSIVALAMARARLADLVLDGAALPEELRILGPSQ